MDTSVCCQFIFTATVYNLHPLIYLLLTFPFSLIFPFAYIISSLCQSYHSSLITTITLPPPPLLSLYIREYWSILITLLVPFPPHQSSHSLQSSLYEPIKFTCLITDIHHFLSTSFSFTALPHTASLPPQHSFISGHLSFNNSLDFACNHIFPLSFSYKGIFRPFSPTSFQATSLV